jgi:hypothetical protein
VRGLVAFKPTAKRAQLVQRADHQQIVARLKLPLTVWIYDAVAAALDLAGWSR